MNENFNFHSLKQFILQNHLNSIKNKTDGMEDITRELLKLSRVFNSNAPIHLVGLMYYFGIGVRADKNEAAKYFREIVNNDIEVLCESLVWLVVIYLQNDSEKGLVPRAKTAEDYFRKLKAIHTDKTPKYYLPYHKFVDVIDLYYSDKGNKQQALKEYFRLAKEDHSANIEIKLLLNELREIFDVDKKEIASEQNMEDNLDYEKNSEKIPTENESSIFSSTKAHKLKSIYEVHPIFKPSKSRK